MALARITLLLSSWDAPRRGKAAERQMRDSLLYLRKIHQAVIAESEEAAAGPVDLTERVAAAVGLPPSAVNPMLTRTIAANLRVIERKEKLGFP